MPRSLALVVLASFVLAIGCGKSKPTAKSKEAIEAELLKKYTRAGFKIKFLHADPKLTIEQVKEILGPPTITQEGAITKRQFWSWAEVTYDEANDRVDRFATINFDKGVVESVEFTP